MARALIIKFKGAVKVLITHNHELTQKTTLYVLAPGWGHKWL